MIARLRSVILAMTLMLLVGTSSAVSAQTSYSADSLGYRVLAGQSLRLDHLTLGILLPRELLTMPSGREGLPLEELGTVRGMTLRLTPSVARRLQEADSLAAAHGFQLVIGASDYRWVQDDRYSAVYLNGRTDIGLGYLLFGPGNRPVRLDGLLPAPQLAQRLHQYARDYALRHLSGS